MKYVTVDYFKKSGKWYTTETIMISEKLSMYEALHEEIPKHHRIKEMTMVVSDGGDNKDPYIVPHLYNPVD